MPWRELPHTADLRLEITAPDWPQLVGEATLALAAAAGAPRPDAPRQSRPLRVTGADREELLVRWLSETLFWQENENLLAVAVALDEADDALLCGRVEVAPAAEITTRIKAVTFHDLAVSETAGGLTTRIVFDL